MPTVSAESPRKGWAFTLALRVGESGRARLEPREYVMDITSPFVVVPLMALLFLGCILFATLTGKEKDSH
jgi:hypothetical protein